MARYTRQPGQFRIDWSNPLTRGLVFCVPGAYGHWADLVLGRQPTIAGGSLPIQASSSGVLGDFANATSVDWTAFGADELATSTPATVAWIQQGAASSGDTVFHFHPNGSVEAFYVYQNPGIGSDYNFACGAGGSSGVQFNGVGTLTDGVAHRFCLVASNGLVSLTPADWALFFNNDKLSNSGSVAAGPGTATTIRVGALAGNSEYFQGGIGQICIWNRALSDEEARSYQANPYQIYARRIRRQAAEPDPVTSVGLTGVAAAGFVGVLGPAVSIALGGIAASGETGNISRALSTQQVGSRVRSGALNPGDKLFKLGRFARQRRNTVTTPTITQALTGVAAVGEAGSVGSARSAVLSGLAASGVAGTLGPVARALEGSRKRNRGFPVGKGPYDFGRFATPRRNVNPAQTAVQSLTGVASTASTGTVVPTRTIVLTGVAATGQVGSVSASQAGVVSLTGVGSTAGVGTVSPAISIALTGVQAVGQVGSVSAVSGTIVELTGVQALGEVGGLAVHVSRGLTGVSAVGSAGTMIGTTPGTWVPVNTEASVEGWTPIAPD